MPKYANRKDQNQNDIVAALERAGCAVTDMSGAGLGFPDLFVTRAGTHYLIEIKFNRGKLRPSQVEFHAKHAPVYTARSVDQALEIVGLKRK
jgi:Holliday junction resolvase